MYPELVDSQINDEDILLSSGNTTDSQNNNLTAFRQMSESDWAYMDQIIVSVTEPDMNRVEKIKAIHDWMVKNIKYDTNMKQHNASDTLNNGVAVCSGYAALFANFMDTLGIPNLYVYGTAHNSQGNRGGHAWNLIELEDGKYYLVDVTWDDPLFYNTSDYKDGSNMNYDYFLVAVRNVTNHTSSIEMASPLATENCNWQSFMGKRVIIDPDPEPTPEPTPKPEPQSEPIPAPEPMPDPHQNLNLRRIQYLIVTAKMK